MRDQKLYQVVVEDRRGELRRVGPAMGGYGAHMLQSTINGEIRSGKEKVWSNPHVVEIMRSGN
jgi:hypothetical protein